MSRLNNKFKHPPPLQYLFLLTVQKRPLLQFFVCMSTFYPCPDIVCSLSLLLSVPWAGCIFSGYSIIGIKHGFSCINIRQVPREVLKTEAGSHGFKHLPRDLANVNALKNHVRSLLLHKK